MFDSVFGKKDNKDMLILTIIGTAVFVAYGIYDFIVKKVIDWAIVAASVLLVSNVIFYLVNYLHYKKKENLSNIQYTQRVKEEIDNERLGYDWETVFFTIPKENFIKSERRVLIREIFTIIAILFVAIIACVIPIFIDIYSLKMAIFVSIFCLICIIPEHITNIYQSGIGYTRYIPDKIEIQYNKLHIDNECYDKNNVEQILLSSPCVGEHNRIRYNELIIFSGKKKKIYKFNNRFNKFDFNGFCYKDFFEKLTKWSVRNKINIKTDMF